ncbi:MAG: ABC transporter ATP-binding protein [Acidimicrobiales bacterium]|nr:ABC transporter ATP-binding protein [Acidimicrobiales bacterium]
MTVTDTLAPPEPVPPVDAIRFLDVAKTYGSGDNAVTALAGVTLTVAAGEMVAIMGPSGCGKSTLLHLAGGLEDPTSGTVVVGGRPVSAMTPSQRATMRRRDVGYVFQRLNLVPSLTALENVMLPLELDGIPTRDARDQAREALSAMGLDRLDRYPDDFSGGQQQRIAIARATTGTRRLVLADEPTGALDTANGDQVIELLAALPARGAAVVLVTHEPRFASWADRVVFLRDGRVVDQSEADDGGRR